VPPAASRPRRAARAAAPALAAALALACSSAPAPAPPPAAARPELAATLVQTGAQALAAGDLATAEQRFARALEADAASAAARVGLGDVALARGDLAGAEARFLEALAREPGAVDARLGLARVAVRQGRAAEARAQLEEALRADPWRAEVHAERAALTGPAPPAPAALALEEALRRARAHPYDVGAGLAAGRALAAAGHRAEAVRALESILWLADLDPRSARRAFALLGRLDPAWRERPVVPVHTFADESIRAQPGWPFRVRLAWLGATRSLEALLDVRFVPVRIGGFASAGAPESLEAIDGAFRAQRRALPASGVVAVFTGRAPPRGRGEVRLGQAEFLGRRLAVRLEAEPGPSRVLVHELLHLYGAVHVAADVPSLMNPSGEARGLDRFNARIVREMRARGFAGDLEADVLDVIDLEDTTRAYEDALRANLGLRRAGLAEVFEKGGRASLEARRSAVRAVELDPHLGDVARFVSLLLWRGDKPASAALLLETAARLYGPRTARGRQAAEDAARLWEESRRSGG
jgi:tetratricopeptide (TPR) repeat protein